MNWDVILNWTTVALGVVLTGLAVRATLYFRRYTRELDNSWVVVAFYDTALTTTLVSAYFTVARIVTLIWGRLPILSVLSGFAIIWLLLLPLRRQRLFEEHEGKP